MLPSICSGRDVSNHKKAERQIDSGYDKHVMNNRLTYKSVLFGSAKFLLRITVMTLVRLISERT